MKIKYSVTNKKGITVYLHEIDADSIPEGDEHVGHVTTARTIAAKFVPYHQRKDLTVRRLLTKQERIDAAFRSLDNKWTAFVENVEKLDQKVKDELKHLSVSNLKYASQFTIERDFKHYVVMEVADKMKEGASKLEAISKVLDSRIQDLISGRHQINSTCPWSRAEGHHTTEVCQQVVRDLQFTVGRVQAELDAKD